MTTGKRFGATLVIAVAAMAAALAPTVPALAATGDELTGRASVIDGDTIEILAAMATSDAFRFRLPE